MTVFPVNRVVDKKRIIRKNGGPRGGGVADPNRKQGDRMSLHMNTMPKM
jgi:hypothetical protein